MKSITTLFVLVSSFLVYYNVETSETREVGSFDGIEISGNFEFMRDGVLFKKVAVGGFEPAKIDDF